MKAHVLGFCVSLHLFVFVRTIRLEALEPSAIFKFNVEYYTNSPVYPDTEKLDGFPSKNYDLGGLDFDDDEILSYGEDSLTNTRTGDNYLSSREKAGSDNDDFRRRNSKGDHRRLISKHRKLPRNTIFIMGRYQKRNTTKDTSDKPQPLDSWSVVWYIASFGGLIVFFLVVSCSEWCCRRNSRRPTHQASQTTVGSTTITLSDTPPPSYEHFAPPSYESCFKPAGEKSEYDVYVVPVHTLGSILESEKQDDPPSYYSASMGDIYPSSRAVNVNVEVPLVHSCEVVVSRPMT